MATAADYEPELVEALNLLIEDERASVEMEVALASGATEYTERDTLTRMGADDIHSCETLRAEMESADLPVTPQINGVVFEVLGAERYDDRLRSFAHHQRIVAERASDLLESNLDGDLREALVSIVENHQRHIEWATQRADTFAASRLLEFGPRHATPAEFTPVAPPEDVSGEVAGEALETATAEELPGVEPALPEIAPVETEPEVGVEARESEAMPEESAPKRPALRKRATTLKTPRSPKAPTTRPRATRARKPPTLPSE